MRILRPALLAASLTAASAPVVLAHQMPTPEEARRIERAPTRFEAPEPRHYKIRFAAAYNKFQPFVENLAEKVFNFGTDQFVVALSNVAPNAANGVLTDITEIAYTNLSSRNVTTSSSAQSAGVYKYVAADLVLTASGAVATFQYVILYSDTAASDQLVAWYDYGSAVTMASAETFTIDFDGTGGVFTIT
jgi:hypothetical protein